MILSYSLISSLILILCYLAFRIFLAGKRQHAINRCMLLLIYALSLMIPVAVLAVLMHNPYPDQHLASGLPDIVSGETANTIIENNGANHAGFLSKVKILKLLYAVYILGLIATMLYYLYGIAMLWKLMKKGERNEFEKFSLVLINDSYRVSPFSWHDTIVMRKSDYGGDGDMILIHEFAHLKLLHWADLVLAYFTICLQWYNPAAWAMREELKAVHEYQADETVIKSGINTKKYQMLLLKRALSSGYQTFANNLYHSKLQKRIAMMYEEKTSLKRRMLALALVPAIGIGIAIAAIPTVAGFLISIAETLESKPSGAVAYVPDETQEERVVYTMVEHQAEFPGGMDYLGEWLNQNLVYPEDAEKAGIQGRVIIKFIIEANGTVTHPEIVRGLSLEVDKEAIRLVSSMPKWTPGKVNGKEVASYFTIPLVFRL